eukprot:scpid95169/ scgid20649/ 
MVDQFSSLDIYIVCVFVSGPLAAIILSFIVSFFLIRCSSKRHAEALTFENPVKNRTKDQNILDTDVSFTSSQPKSQQRRAQPPIPDSASYPSSSAQQQRPGSNAPPPLPAGPLQPNRYPDFNNQAGSHNTMLHVNANAPPLPNTPPPGKMSPRHSSSSAWDTHSTTTHVPPLPGGPHDFGGDTYDMAEMNAHRQQRQFEHEHQQQQQHQPPPQQHH